ncbi:SGNH/GDSL hydrolase family protein [bacterium]|nr:SGNH/GDSL hydrolase family protein [bacterium]
MKNGPLKRLFTLYLWLAAVSFSLALAYFACDRLFIELRNAGDTNPLRRRYGDMIYSLYPGMERSQVDKLLRESWMRNLEYEPFTQYREARFKGEYVNVDEHGFRSNGEDSTWPPDSGACNVFLFGGSTTFNYGVADSCTIAARLQEILAQDTGKPVRVYNFGRAMYYSTQERVLFEKLLLEGKVPQMAVFIDGLNEFSHPDDVPNYTRSLENHLRAIAHFKPDYKSKSVFFREMFPLADIIFTQISRLFQRNASVPEENFSHSADSVLCGQIIQRYLQNKKMTEAVASGYGVKARFVWQPIPVYMYDKRNWVFPLDATSKRVLDLTASGYVMMSRLTKLNPPGGHFFWCADIQAGSKENLYIDIVHYGESLSRMLAHEIADSLKSCM